MTKEEENRIKKIIRDANQFFVKWLNGSIDQDELEWIEARMHHDLKIVYAGNPDELVSKSDLLKKMPNIHGSTSDKPIGRHSEIKLMKKLTDDKVLVTTLEKTLVDDEVVRTRPMSTIFSIGNTVQVWYSHE